MQDDMADNQTSAVAVAPNERFYRYFQNGVADLQAQLACIEKIGTSGGERTDAIDHCRAAISRLSTEVHDAASSVPARDKRTYGEAIKGLYTKLQHVRAASLPRQKFSFKKTTPIFTATKNESAISLTDAAELAQQKRNPPSDSLPGRESDSRDVNRLAGQIASAHERTEDESDLGDGTPGSRPVRRLSFSDGHSVTISNRENVHLVLPTAASHVTGSGTVANITSCVIDMSSATTWGQPLATLTLKNISSSLIICGRVNGAAHVTNVRKSVIVVASRQFRMHDSANCDVYLLATSRPIIEDCSTIHFAPLPRAFMTDQDQDVGNQWSNVDDFKWLRNEQSPHWSLLAPHLRISDQVWRDTVSDRRDRSVHDILHAVHLS